MSEQVRAGTLKLQDFFEAESCMHRSHGHCMTMGTASTMASMVEALGIGLPGNAAYPAVDGRRNVLARESGRRIVDMVHRDVKISKILTREAFECHSNFGGHWWLNQRSHSLGGHCAPLEHSTHH
jgi:dihydroxy-acid dehydratase